MTPEAGSGRGGHTLEDRINQVAPRVEEEVKKVIAYLNDAIVPGVRSNSSRALRAASERLAKLAGMLDSGAPKDR